MIEISVWTSYQEDAMAEGMRPLGQLVSGLDRIQICYEATLRELEAALGDFLEHQKAV